MIVEKEKEKLIIASAVEASGIIYAKERANTFQHKGDV